MTIPQGTLCEHPQVPDAWSPYRWCPSSADYAVFTGRPAETVSFYCRHHTLWALQAIPGVSAVNWYFPSAPARRRDR